MKPTTATILAATMALTATGGVVSSASRSDGGRQLAKLPDVCEQRPGRSARFEEAKLLIEYNATDGDIGVHGAFDDEGWRELCVLDPDGRPIAVFDPAGRLDRLGMAGVFFESREPPLDEFDFDDLARAFPEGKYRVRAVSFDGEALVGRAVFTHDVPRSPEITAPELAEDAEAPGRPIDRREVVVRWNDVTRTVAGDPVDITGYEVIVTKEDAEDRNGFSRPVYDVHVGPDRNSLSVPSEFFDRRSVYEVEVLALEVSGNQTISVGFFRTA